MPLSLSWWGDGDVLDAGVSVVCALLMMTC